MKTGIELITDERVRQIRVEGWTQRHDDKHTDRALAKAAACYALGERIVMYCGVDSRHYPILSDFWPWDLCDWKPSDPIRNLVKAGALIAAEIDRLQRLKNAQSSTE